MAFALNIHRSAETLIDKTIELQSVGGVYGNQKPTEFISLLLKLLQIQPEKEILVEYLRADEFKFRCHFRDSYKYMLTCNPGISEHWQQCTYA